jgi:hypothetical protein
MVKSKTKYKFYCLKCKTKFESRVECPAECPNCHSPTWDEERKISAKNEKKGKKNEGK